MTQRAVELISKAATESGTELESRLAIAAPPAGAEEFMWMPGGLQTSFSRNLQTGRAVKAEILVDRQTAIAIQQQFEELSAKKAPHRPYFDLNHDDAEASFWPSKFTWRDGDKPGVYVQGEWSGAGKTALEAKNYRAFSPRYWVDNPNGKPARIICNPAAKLNMGGLVNDPGFEDIAPLWSKHSETDDTDPMNKIAQLEAKLSELAATITELTAKKGDDTAAGNLKTAQAEKRALEAELTAARAEEENTKLKADLAGRNQAAAKTAVAAAVKRGALPAKNTELQAKWQSELEADPGRVALLEAIAGNPALGGENLTTGSARRLEVKEGPKNVIKGFMELTAKNAGLRSSLRTVEDKRDLANQAAMIYRAEMAGKNFLDYTAAIEATIAEMTAADPTDANIGILSGTLVAQRTLELFKYELPMLRSMSTDFSEMPANLNQVIDTRIVQIPGVQAYDPTLGADNEPNGWRNITKAAATTDVKVTLNELVGVPIRFTLDVLSSTIRRIFDEQAPAATYALADYFIQKAYKLMTPANYAAYAAIVAATVPTAYVTYVKSKVDFGRSALADLKGIFTQNLVPKRDRICFLNSAYHTQLEKDPSIVTFYAGQRAPEIITEGELPMLSGFKPWESPDLAANNATANLVGFAMQKNALVIATRLPQDLNQVLPGVAFGSVITVTDPDTGLVMQLVQFINQASGYAEWRLQVILGAAVGDSRGGLCLTSA